MSVRVQCPSCGGPVVFEVGSSMVAVCPYCRSAVARGDRTVEDLGKVAALVETGAVLKVGSEGRYDGRRFHLTGRTQLAHPAGGVWDEWYAAFADGRWGWLSEAQGRYYLLFEQLASADRPLPHGLEVGTAVELPEAEGQFVVAETATATVNGAEGELPFLLRPGETYQYADLSGPDDAFATLAGSHGPPALYLGRQVTLDDLARRGRATHEFARGGGLGGRTARTARPARTAPRQDRRVGCSTAAHPRRCAGDLAVLSRAEEPPFTLRIPLGTTGTLGGKERTVIGAFRRSVTVEGKDYFWTEYLLYHPRDGFEWLINADGHWTHAAPLPPGAVTEGSHSATANGVSFRKFQAGVATVRGVIGECYWKVTVGETATTADFIRPPLMLSLERATYGAADEINWSLGTYLTPAEVQTAFKLDNSLPAPTGVAPNQPFGYTKVYKYAALLFVALCVLGIVVILAVPQRKVHEQSFQLRGPAAQPLAPDSPPVPATPKVQEFFTELFELKARRNVRVTVSAPNMTGWLVVEGDLVEQATGQVQPFLVPLEFYTGVEDGEAWTEGDKHGSAFVTAQPVGKYSLRLEVDRETLRDEPLTVTVEQGASNGGVWFLTFLAIAVVPLVTGVCHLVFVNRRWQNSDIAAVGGIAATTRVEKGKKRQKGTRREV